MTDDYDDVEKNNMMVMVVNAIHWMIRKGPIDNIIETLDEKGGEIVINGQNGHLWLFDHQNISKGIPENSYENVLGHCNMLIANFTAKKFFLCFPVETLKTKILCQVTLMGPTFSPKLVSFSSALDKNKQTTRIQNYLSHFFLNSFVFFFSSSSFCRMLGPLMVGIQSLFI